MNVSVNGLAKELPENSTIADILVLLDIVGRRVAVEVNEHIVPKSQHAHVVLQAHDKVEIVHAIGGG